MKQDRKLPNLFQVTGVRGLADKDPNYQLLCPPTRAGQKVNLHREIYLPTKRAQEFYEEMFGKANDPTMSPDELRRMVSERFGLGGSGWLPLQTSYYSSTYTTRDVKRESALREALFAVHDAVVANPNTPVDLLIALGGEHIDALSCNPVLPMLPLEMPDLDITHLRLGIVFANEDVAIPLILRKLWRAYSR